MSKTAIVETLLDTKYSYREEECIERVIFDSGSIEGFPKDFMDVTFTMITKNDIKFASILVQYCGDVTDSSTHTKTYEVKFKGEEAHSDSSSVNFRLMKHSITNCKFDKDFVESLGFTLCRREVDDE